jgi:hypothetical protein
MAGVALEFQTEARSPVHLGRACSLPRRHQPASANSRSRPRSMRLRKSSSGSSGPCNPIARIPCNEPPRVMGTPAPDKTPLRAAISRAFGPKALERVRLARGFPVATISAKVGCSARGKLRPRTQFPPESSTTGMTVSSSTRKKAARGCASTGNANSVASLSPNMRIALSASAGV